MQDHRDLATELVAALKRNGADACDVYIGIAEGFTATVRLGAIEKLQQSTSKGLGLRVFRNGATALTFTTDFRDRAVNDLIGDLLEIVKVSSSDEFNGLAPRESLGICDGDLDLVDDGLAAVPTERKIELARETEDAGRNLDVRISNSNGANWSDSISQVTLANSDGFVGQYRATNASLSVSLLAEEDGVKQRDGWYTLNRFVSGLEAAAAVGETAARRTIARLGGRKIKSQAVPVVVSPEVAGEFVAMIFNAASGVNIYRRSSYLIGKIGEVVAAPAVTIVDDATIRGGLASRPFDAEGVRSSPVTVIENGVLQRYVCDSYSARRLNSAVTGNSVRGYSTPPSVGASNLYIRNGDSDPKAIIGSVKSGLYLTEMFGSGVNSVTGDFSQGASGFWIENGEITYPVQEITIAGNVLEALANVEAIGNDLSFGLGSIASPTLLVSKMTIGGS